MKLKSILQWPHMLALYIDITEKFLEISARKNYSNQYQNKYNCHSGHLTTIGWVMTAQTTWMIVGGAIYLIVAAILGCFVYLIYRVVW